MKCHSADQGSLNLFGLYVLSLYLRQIDQLATITLIRNNGMPGILQVHPDLVLSPGYWPALHQAAGFKFF